jgi:hypothetical protein
MMPKLFAVAILKITNDATQLMAPATLKTELESVT